MVKFQEFREEQMRLANQVVTADRVKHPKTFGGVSINYVNNRVVYACIAVCDAKTLSLIESKVVSKETTISYKPGFLAYRVLPAIIDAYHQLETKPDILLVHGHGITHPRRLGLASHLGLVLDVPTVGVADSLLLGSIEQGKVVIRGEQRGFEFLSRQHAKPIFVSPGHLVSLGTALHIIKSTIKPPHKMPEPIHIANKISKKEVKKDQSSSLPVDEVYPNI